MNELSDDPRSAVDEGQLYCYGHPKTPTRLRCTRCERPICGRCAIPASVGQHCPECVAEARRSAPKVRTRMAARAPAVMTIIGINIVVYVIQQLSPEVTFRFASFGPAVAAGEWWRLMTAMFLHAPDLIFHILFNMFVLYTYGPHVEEAFGTVRFVAMYLIAGFLGSAASYAFGGAVLSVGASGAIFGTVGVLLAYLYRRRGRSFVDDYVRSLLLFVGVNLLFGLLSTRIDNLAHVGGLVGGLLLGLGFDRGGRSVPNSVQAATALGVVSLGVLLVLMNPESPLGA